MGTKWTDEESDRLRELAAMGLSHREIGRRLGRSRNAVWNRLNHISGKPFSLGRICSDCAKPIRNENTSGRCKVCATIYNNRLPDSIEKRRVGWAKRLANPRHYADLCRVAKQNSRKAMADPAKRAAAAERARLIWQQYLNTPEMREYVNSPEVRSRAGRSLSETRMAWCPPEYRSAYYDIRRKVQCSAADARQIILDQIKSDQAKLSPFERQMLALQKGARLVANDATPPPGNVVVRRFG